MRVGIIGHFGGDAEFNDGQTIKVRTLYHGLSRKLKDRCSIDVVDTYYLSHNRFKLCFDFLKCLLLDKKIIFLPATNGRRILFPLMYYLSVFFRKEIYHDCIGGALIRELETHPKWIKYLRKYEGNWMESQKQTDALKKMGIMNAQFIPNFKHIVPVEIENIKKEHVQPYRFCTFSRVMQEKGIEDAINAIEDINKKCGEGVAFLDIYGEVQQGYEERFQKIIDNSKWCNYCGVIEAEKSVEILEPYFALLFPTRYYTEGMPGTIIDAMFAGVPVISRRWIYCDEMIYDGYNGISYDFDKVEDLCEIVERVIKYPSILDDMKINCICEANKYTEENVLNRVVCEMNIKL